MKNKTGILFASVDGQTLKISKKIKEVFENNHHSIEIINIKDFNGEVKNFNKLIIGSSIRYGVHNDKIIDFINLNKEELDKIKTAFFSVNLVARKPEKKHATTNPYVVKFFNKIKWKPAIVEVFAGMLDYRKYKFFDRIMIQFIMWMTKGPTNKNTKIEYTNWDRVENFAKKLIAY
jgi:menaquinone-dependent protoporphyrinogen oxidase